MVLLLPIQLHKYSVIDTLSPHMVLQKSIEAGISILVSFVLAVIIRPFIAEEHNFS